MKLYFLVVIASLMLVNTGQLSAAEASQVNSVSGTATYSTPLTVLVMGKDMQLTFDALGVFASDSPDHPFNNASVRIIGSGLMLKGAYTETGSAVYTLPTGDQVFTVYQGKSEHKKFKGDISVTGGTGAFKGINGKGKFVRTNVAKTAKKGTTQGYLKLSASWDALHSDPQ